jgi:hypothetical protein
MTMTYSNAASTMVHHHYDYLQADQADDLELSNLLDEIFPEMLQLHHQEAMMMPPNTNTHTHTQEEQQQQQQQNHFVPVSPSSSVMMFNNISTDDIPALQVANYKPQGAVRVSPVPSGSKSRVAAKVPPSPSSAGSSSSSSRKRSISTVSETSVDPDKRQTVQRR